jgi:holo-[acyl-carrier protein] synthase
MGLDLASIERISALIEGRRGERFLERVFLPRERALCEARKDRAAAYAARFAAKEAFVKALGVPKGISWQHIEVVRGTAGSPTLKLSGRAAEVMRRRSARAILTLSHDAGVAVAVVLILTERGGRR